MQDLLGAMSVKQVARSDDGFIADPALARNFTPKHFDEIENYHKNIVQDSESKKALFAKIRENAVKRGTKATRKYMKEANKPGSVYYDPNAPKDRVRGGNGDTATPDEELFDAYGNPIDEDGNPLV